MFYAVHRGRITGVFTTWGECKIQVHKYPSAWFKAFKNIEEGFHTYKVNWTAEKIEFLVDNKLVYTYAPLEKTESNWPFNKPQFILLNMAVGGNFGGPEVDDSIFPQEYIVDYIKVYQTK